MDLWHKVKDRLSKTLDQVEARSSELKESIHFQLEINKLKSQLDEIRLEQLTAYREIGEDYYSLSTQGVDFDKIKLKLAEKVDFVSDLVKKMESLQREINDAYTKQRDAESEQNMDSSKKKEERD